MGRCTVVVGKGGPGIDDNRDEQSVIIPFLCRTRSGGRTGKGPRLGLDLERASTAREECSSRSCKEAEASGTTWRCMPPPASASTRQAVHREVRQRVEVQCFEISISFKRHLKFVKAVVPAPALAVGCLCLRVRGLSRGVWASRSDYLSIFVICFLPTLLTYYPLLLAGLNVARDGKLGPLGARRLGCQRHPGRLWPDANQTAHGPVRRGRQGERETRRQVP